MLKTTKLTGKSQDIIKTNIEQLKELFPEICTEDKIDFDKLKIILGEEVESDSERYNFTWAGKQQAIREANKQSTGTLRPCIGESKNWDSTENLYIEGDNLEVLKLLQKTYNGKIKMIYIDPPYNTGKEFVYTDDYKDNLDYYLKLTGQKDEDSGVKYSTNTETRGRYHSNWLNMMYPRLKLARNLLSNDGIIFINIDDREIGNLRKICDEIFGEMNFIRNVIWEKKYSPANDSKVISDNHDHILVYSKDIANWKMGLLPRTEEMNKRYINKDNDSRGRWKAGGLSAKTYNEKYDYPVKTPSGKIVYPPSGSCWQVSKERLQELINDNRIYFGVNNDSKPQIKQFLSEVQQGMVSRSIWKYNEVGHNQVSRKEITDIFNNFIFDTPKPTKLINRCMKIANLTNGLILDFFSGSATTAHSVMQFNSENNLNNKFIMVQLPEPTDEKSEAYKAGYNNICEIGKERIRRAGDKILSESTNPDLDIGFKVFKLDTSNMKEWDPDYNELESSLIRAEKNIKTDRTEYDLIYEIMLKYGLDLTIPITKHENLYSIGHGTLLACLGTEITTDIVNDILKYRNEEITRVLFYDNGFKTDSDKANIIETLKNHNITEFITI